MAGISRRRFVRNAAVVGAGIALQPGKAFAAMGGGCGGGCGGGGGGMGGGSSVIDPPVGGPFADPVPLEQTLMPDGALEVSLEVKPATIGVNGVAAQLLTYNGLFPGGMIRARRGDLLRVKVTNSLPDDGATNVLGHGTRITNLHTHGLHVTPGYNMNGTPGDNMLIQIPPGGGQQTYEYDLAKMYPGTLNFYHPHIHGSVTDQMWAGMAGPLVIEDEVGSLLSYETHVLVLKDITLANGVPVPHTSAMQYMHGVEGDTVLVNGTVNPRMYIKAGQVQRWRILNASTARFYRLSLASHAMYLVGTEGGLLDRPYQVSEILVSPGERVDVLVRADKAASSYKFVSLPYSRMGMMSSAQITLMTLTYRGSTSRQPLPATVDPSATRLYPDLSMLPQKSMTLSMSMSAGYVNGIQFTSHENCYTAMSDVGGYEVWDIVNTTNMDHPFHHHVNAAQVLSITGGDAKYAAMCTQTPAWKDVTIVPKGGRIRLLMQVMDYTGMAMFHCHIIDHEDIGMMGMWHLMGDMDDM